MEALYFIATAMVCCALGFFAADWYLQKGFEDNLLEAERWKREYEVCQNAYRTLHEEYLRLLQKPASERLLTKYYDSWTSIQLPAPVAENLAAGDANAVQ